MIAPKNYTTFRINNDNFDLRFKPVWIYERSRSAYNKQHDLNQSHPLGAYINTMVPKAPQHLKQLKQSNERKRYLKRISHITNLPFWFLVQNSYSGPEFFVSWNRISPPYPLFHFPIFSKKDQYAKYDPSQKTKNLQQKKNNIRNMNSWNEML